MSASSKGTPLDAQNIVNRHFKPLLRRAGLPDIRWHDLRHTYATLLLARHPPDLCSEVSRARIGAAHPRPLLALDIQHGKTCRRRHGRGFGIESTADKAPDATIGGFLFLRVLQEKKRADERTRTADLISLRVIIQALQGFAEACKSRISKRLSLLLIAACCTVLRSRWYQSSINIILVSARHCRRTGETTSAIVSTLRFLEFLRRRRPQPHAISQDDPGRPPRIHRRG